MHLVVRSTEALKEELVSRGLAAGTQVTWAFEKDSLLQYHQADVVIDFLFKKEDTAMLQQLRGLKIISSVVDTLPDTDPSFVRINGWPTFLQAQTIEASCQHEDLKKLAENVFAVFGKQLEWLPDEPGFVVPRVVSLIINEAYFALAEHVSTRDEIDTAMKLGTAYPFGPFEWSEKIGLKNIVALLTKLSRQQERYTPAPLLMQQVGVI